MTETNLPHQETKPLILMDDEDSETIEVDMEEFFKNESQQSIHQLGFPSSQSQKSENPKTFLDQSKETPKQQLPSLTKVLGTQSSQFPHTLPFSSINLNQNIPQDSSQKCPISLPTSFSTKYSLSTSFINSNTNLNTNLHTNSLQISSSLQRSEYQKLHKESKEYKTRGMKQRQDKRIQLHQSVITPTTSLEISHENSREQSHEIYRENSKENSHEFYKDSSEEKKPKKQFKTEPRRLTYLREKKIFGRNEESEIINGLQYLLANYHGAIFDYVKEKRSKKTVKFRMPYSMTYEGITYSSLVIAEMGEQWLIDRGLCMKCNEKIVTAKRIQRSKEAEVNGGLICILHSLGYEFEFKKLKDKLDRKTTPFVKISQFKFPNENEFRSVDELKKLGRKYNEVMLMQEEQLVSSQV